MSNKKSIAIPCNFAKRGNWFAGSGIRGNFLPLGNPSFSNPAMVRKNPPMWEGQRPTWSARLFVGFNVGAVPTYSMDHLISVVRTIRKKQGALEDSSFLYQKGIYTHSEGKGVVQEDGAQIIIINMEKGAEEFEKDMQDLAEQIATDMQQESVVLEIQRDGVVHRTLGMAPIAKKTRGRKK